MSGETSARAEELKGAAQKRGTHSQLQERADDELVDGGLAILACGEWLRCSNFDVSPALCACQPVLF